MFYQFLNIKFCPFHLSTHISLTWYGAYYLHSSSWFITEKNLFIELFHNIWWSQNAPQRRLGNWEIKLYWFCRLMNSWVLLPRLFIISEVLGYIHVRNLLYFSFPIWLEFLVLTVIYALKHKNHIYWGSISYKRRKLKDKWIWLPSMWAVIKLSDCPAALPFWV